MLIKLVAINKIPKEPLITALRKLLFNRPYRYGNSHNTTHPTTPAAIFAHIMMLFDKYVDVPDGVRQLIHTTPQVQQEEAQRQRAAETAMRAPTASNPV